jgi:P4 family phage/plasmid primase-like protien
MAVQLKPKENLNKINQDQLKPKENLNKINQDQLKPKENLNKINLNKDKINLNKENINIAKTSLISFNKFMEERVMPKGSFHTHTNFGPPWKIYNVEDKDYDTFLDLYSKMQSNNKINLNLTERPKDVGPILIDIDLKFDVKHKERQYTQEQVKYIITKYLNVLNKYYTLSKKQQKSFVFEKNKPTEVIKQDQPTTYKDGFHIIFPNFSVPIKMRYLVRHEVIKDITEEIENKENKFKLSYINSLDEVVDKAIIEQNGWLMYGSKKPEGQLYSLTQVYKHDFTTEDPETYIKSGELPGLLSNRKFADNSMLTYSDKVNKLSLERKLQNVVAEYGLRHNKLLKKPLEPEIYDKNMILNDDDEYDSNEEDSSGEDNSDEDDEEREARREARKNKKNKVNRVNQEENEENQENQENKDQDQEVRGENINIRQQVHNQQVPKKSEVLIAKELTKLLNKDRASDYNKWVRVGWALKTISPNLLDSFKLFSQKDKSKYSSKSCEEVWAAARNVGYTLKALHHWASADSPLEYLNLLRINIKTLVTHAESGTEYDIAVVIHELYGHQFVCSSIKHNTWYEFQKHRWVQIESAYTLKNKISNDLTKEFAHLNSYYYNKASTVEGGERDNLLKKAENVVKIINKLKKNSFKKSVLDECTNLFYDKPFKDNLDSNRDIIGFDNGVYDFSTMCFRDGIPEDFLTFSVGYEWIEYAKDDPKIAEIDEYFKKVMIEEPMREYIKTQLASYLDGYTKKQNLNLWTGTGSNSKSKTVEFFQMAFGQYCGVLPITVLTRKQGGPSSATPEMACLRGKRFVIFQEPEGDDSIQVGRMKELTGGDKINARPLFEDTIEFRPQFKLLLTCNKLPYIPSTDGGTWRRLRVAPFESEFVDIDKDGLSNGKKLKPNQFPKDYDLETTIEKLKKVFMWYLITLYYPKYKKDGLKEPPKVLAFTNKYKKDSDIYFEFLSESISETKDKKDRESVNSIYNMFKEWYRSSYASNKCPSKKELVDYLGCHDNYNYDKGYVHGWKFNYDEEE